MNRYISSDMEAALNTLKEGGVILYPTDTVWGIGCDATNADAVAKIYKIKERIDSKSMLLLINGGALIDRYATMPEVAWDIIENTDKPISIIYPGAKNIAPNLIAEDGSIGIRVTNELFTSDLIKRFKKPIVSTSANISGEPSAPYFDMITEQIKSRVDYVVQYKQADREKSTPSSIIKLGARGEVTIIRE